MLSQNDTITLRAKTDKAQGILNQYGTKWKIMMPTFSLRHPLMPDQYIFCISDYRIKAGLGLIESLIYLKHDNDEHFEVIEEKI